MTDLLILNGPGLDDLSNCESYDYGDITLEKIKQQCSELCNDLGIKLDFRQSNDETEITRLISEDSEHFDAIILNPVSYSKSSTVNPGLYHSPLKSIAHLKKPIIEVHICNVYHPQDESIRPLEVPEAGLAFISGLGVNSYLTAIKAIHRKLN